MLLPVNINFNPRKVKPYFSQQTFLDKIQLNPNEYIIINTKHIIQQNKFTNINLNIIRKQMTRLEKQIQKPLVSPIETSSRPIDQKLKNSIFKP